MSQEVKSKSELLKYSISKEDLAEVSFKVFQKGLINSKLDNEIASRPSFNGGIVSALSILKRIIKESFDEIETEEINPDIIKGAKKLETEVLWEIEEFANVFTKQYDKEEK